MARTLRRRPFDIVVVMDAIVSVPAVVTVVLFDPNLDQKFDPNLDQTIAQNLAKPFSCKAVLPCWFLMSDSDSLVSDFGSLMSDSDSLVSSSGPKL